MKTVKIKSALPLYACALVWILFGLFAPLYRWKYLLLAAGISVVVYILFSVIFPGRTEEVEEKVSTGDAEIDRQIEEGRAQLKALQSANDAIEDEHISNQLARMTKAGGQIFSVLEKDTSKANDVRRFMNYYLPTTKKLLDGYQQLRATGATSGNVAEAMTSVENSLEIIRTILSEPGTYAICFKEDGRPIGDISLMVGEQSNIALSDKDGELGFWLGVPFWGQGIMPEAMREMIRYAFEDLGLEALWCGYFDGNEKSSRVQEKCGFRYIRTEKDIYWKATGEIKTEHISRLTKEEWLDARGAGA